MTRGRRRGVLNLGNYAGSGIRRAVHVLDLGRVLGAVRCDVRHSVPLAPSQGWANIRDSRECVFRLIPCRVLESLRLHLVWMKSSHQRRFSTPPETGRTAVLRLSVIYNHLFIQTHFPRPSSHS